MSDAFPNKAQDQSLTRERDQPIRYAVTGAGGFIGTRLFEIWEASGRSGNIAIVRRESSATRLREVGARVVVADLLRPATIEPALAGCAAVVHLAHGERGPEATRNLLRAMAHAGVRRLIHISTMSVHGPSPGTEAAIEDTATIGRYGNDYCDSKAEQEELVWAAQRNGTIDAIILRPTVVYGPGSGFVSLVLEEAATGEVHWVDQGLGRCNAVYVDDVCRAIDAALVSAVKGQAFFINGDDSISWRRFIEAFAFTVPSSPRIVNVDSIQATAYWSVHGTPAPSGLVTRAWRFARRLWAAKPAPPPYPPLGRIQRETIQITFSNAKARAVLGWRPTIEFAEGVRRTLEALRLSAAPKRKRIVVVGAGLGGCTVSDALARDFDVTVIERGANHDSKPQVVVDEARPAITQPHIASGLGGTTSLWHNGLIEIDSSVFDRAWPFSKSQLDPYYRRALSLLAPGLKHEDLAATIADLRLKHLACGMPDGPYPGLFYTRWPMNTWDAFGLAKRVSVVPAIASGFETDGQGRVIAVKTDAGSVQGDLFILAAGGLGTPVLLQRLAAEYSFDGAAHAGRHYEDHPMTFVGELRLDAPLYRLWNYAVPRSGGTLRLPLVVEREGMQVSFQLRPSATVSVSSRRRRVDTVLNDLRRNPWNLGYYLRLLRHPDDLLDILSFKFGVHLPTRNYTLLMVAQMPTRDTLDVWSDPDSEVDPLATHRRWVLSEHYIELLRLAIEDVIRLLGRLAQDVHLFDDWPAALRSSAHHSGTARMAKVANDGVCDPHARVRGLQNLYVCDGSLIPATGIANSGLTIAALALRLADHLRSRAAETTVHKP